MRDRVMALLQRHLEGPFKPSGQSNIVTRCPFHKEGRERKPSFSVSLERGLFQCFSCHVSGDMVHLLRLMQVPPSRIPLEIQGIEEELKRGKEIYALKKQNAFVDQDPFRSEFVLPEALLGVFDWVPDKLIQSGFEAGLLKDMEVGYDKQLQRITYPLRDLYGNLAGISGGATNTDQWPKYLVYQGGRRDENGCWISGNFGNWFDQEFPGFKCENHNFLWNYHRVFPRTQTTLDSVVYVVEGFKACLWMIQNGFPNTVALMGSYISDRQQQMLHRIGCNLVLVLDNDKAGRRATLKIGQILWRPMHGRIWCAQYPEEDNTQPDNYPMEYLHLIIRDSKPFTEHRTLTLKKYPNLLNKPG